MDQYNRALSDIGLMGAQVLLTAADTRLSKSRKNLINTLSKLIAWQAVPILNENDAVATEEIKFGDNDRLSALIAGLVGAQKLILLTNVDGLYSADPESNPAAELVHYKNDVTERDLRAVRAAGKSRMGTGGMYSKLLAARLARKRKIVTHLLRGDQPEVLVRLAQGEKIGTQIGGRP
jgi:glutamate 5-kinase